MSDFTRWPFFGCLAVVLLYVSLAIKYVRQYEGSGRQRRSKSPSCMGIFSIAELDRADLSTSCWGIHPGWLLGFRTFAFCYILPQILYNFYFKRFWMFFFYTEWTFILLTSYFGVAAWFSAKKCIELKNEEREGSSDIPEEEFKLTCEDSGNSDFSSIQVNSGQQHQKEIVPPRLTGYIMQIMFQVAGAAVLMTDSVYWLILVPYVLPKTFRHHFVDINMHFVNAIFLIVEISLNNLNYPWFRISYVVFWTSGYTLFLWALHALGLQLWPYPFLSLSTPFAPAWYAGLSLLHMVLALLVMVIVNVKQHLVWKWRERSVLSGY